MFFNMKTAVFAALIAASIASPLVHLEARAKVPDTVDCDGKEFTKAQINAAIAESHTQHGKYPEPFGNKSGNKKVFSNIVDGAEIYEQPLADTVWRTGPPGKYRVVMNKSYTYIGTMIHIGGTSGLFKKCTDGKPKSSSTSSATSSATRSATPSATPKTTPTPSPSPSPSPSPKPTPMPKPSPSPKAPAKSPAPQPAQPPKAPVTLPGKGKGKKGGKKGGKN